MPGQLLTIARNTFLEAVRQPIYFILIALSGILQLFNTWGSGFSMGYSDTSEVSADNKLLLDIGLATVFVCGMLLTAFIATAVISREIENKTVLTVVSKPVPRPIVVLGKYLGVAAAIMLAVLTMLLFLQMAIRHEVMSTAADTLDGPVFLFTGLAVALAFLVGVWCNYFYGWSFTQTTTMLLLPLMALAWVGVLFINKKWQVQPPQVSFKPQIALASLCILMAQLVVTAIATAVSSRLGQVMTIVVCAGVFFLGLLSNYLVGRHAYENEFIGRIRDATPLRDADAAFTASGDTYTVTLEGQPRVPIAPGHTFYYGPNPSGFDLAVPPYTPFAGDVSSRDDLLGSQTAPALVVTAADRQALTVRNVGAKGVPVRRPPAPDDYVFDRPTRTHPLSLAVWGIIPNVQFFWLVDAVTQNQSIPGRHVALIALYTLTQIGVFLSLAVILFQRREVG